MKTFCSAQDIEDLATRGQTELIIDQNTVLTDLARHTAQQLGVAIIDRSRPDASSTPRPAASPPRPASQPAPRPTAPLGSKPRGCQHGPVTTPQTPKPVVLSSGSGSGGSNTVVDQLVGAVRRLTGRGSDSE